MQHSHCVTSRSTLPARGYNKRQGLFQSCHVASHKGGPGGGVGECTGKCGSCITQAESNSEK